MTDVRFTPPVRPHEIPEIAWRILNAAVKLFAQKGYAATSVREIVQEADVTSPMLYYYFDSKEGLFQNLTSLMYREFQRDIQHTIDHAEDLTAALRQIVEIHFRGVRESPEVIRFVYSLLFGTAGSCPTHDMFESHQAVLAMIGELFQRHEDTGEGKLNFAPTWLASQLLALINSHTMRLVKELELLDAAEQRAWLDSNTNEATVQQLVQFFLSGAMR